MEALFEALITAILKYFFGEPAARQNGIEKAEAIGASDQVDAKLATEKTISTQEIRDGETIAVTAHRTLLE